MEFSMMDLAQPIRAAGQTQPIAFMTYIVA
jgi:hypothetical protein